MTRPVAIAAILLLLLTVGACRKQPGLVSEDAGQETAVTLREQIDALTGRVEIVDVPVIEITTGTVRAELSLTGELAPTQSVIIRPMMDGRLTFLRPLHVGDLVEEGEIVAKIDDRDIEDEIAQQERQIAITSETLTLDSTELEQRRDDLEFDRQLASEGYLTESELRKSELALERARVALRQSGLRLEQEKNRLEQYLRRREKVPIKATISSMVVLASHLTERASSSRLVDEEIMTLEDMLVNPSTELFGIVSREAFEARCRVSGKDKAKVDVGQEATVSVVSHQRIDVPGVVERVALIPEAQSNAYKVWIRLDGSDPSFTSGLFVRAYVELERREGVPVVPREYVKEHDGQRFVQLVEDGKILNREVETGIEESQSIEISAGTAPGDLLVALEEIIVEGQAVNPVRTLIE